MNTAALDALQHRLGHRFQRPELLSRALTHRSYGADHNERLEFLGDAVLSLASPACSTSAMPAPTKVT